MQYTGDGVAITLFGLEIRWYAVFIVTGMMLALYLLSRQMKRRHIDPDLAYDIALWVLPFGIIGARLWYVLFESARFPTFWSVINLRSGGLAIQGGIMAGLLVALVWSKKKHFSLFRLTDMIAPGLALAQGIGRWGNFTNNEAHGGLTDLPWGLWIDGQRYHPTFLYESVGDILLCLFLFWALRRLVKRDGQATALYFIGYGLLRFFVEGLRTDSLYWGPIRVAQALSLIGIVVGIVALLFFQKQAPNAHLLGKNPADPKEVARAEGDLWQERKA